VGLVISDHVDCGGSRFGNIMGIQSIDVEEACCERSELEGSRIIDKKNIG